MKVGTTATNTLITNIDSENRSQFSIKASGAAFSVLSNALYSHKVKAVVREVGCNAHDAHISASNTDRPFDVHLPSEKEPFFKIRDYGIGLSPASFVEVYTTYFGSTKATSNDHTGGLGLGSKSPFCLTKAFTVHSYYNHTEYLWSSYINDDGHPDVALLSSKPSDEPCGLQVVVPVGQGLSASEQQALFKDFQHEADVIYRWFDVIPNVTVDNKAVKIAKQLDQYTGIKIPGADKTTVYYDPAMADGAQTSIIHVKMGNVVYPYDLASVRNLDRFGGNISQTERIIKYLTSLGRLNSAKHPLIVEVGIGAVDIAPSREALSLTNTTELTIINAITRFVDIFFDQIQQNIDKASTVFERYQSLYATPPLTGREFTINGVVVNPSAQTPAWSFGAHNNRTLRQFDTSQLSVKYRRAGTRGIIPLKGGYDIHMYGPGLRDRTIVLVDVAFKGELRLWINANTKPETPCVVVYGLSHSANGKQLSRPLTDVEMAPFLEDQHPQVIKFSQLPNKPAAAVKLKTTLSAKLTGTTGFALKKGGSEYNYFTVGNSRVVALDDIAVPSVISASKTPAIKSAYIIFRKSADRIECHLTKQTNVDGKTIEQLELTRIVDWSRSTSSTTNWTRGCEFLKMITHSLPVEVNATEFNVNIDGVPHRTKLINLEQVVLHRTAYDEIVANPDLYPHMFTVDRYIREVLAPMFPTSDVHMHTFDRSEVLVRQGGSGVSAMLEQLKLGKFKEYQLDLIKLSQNTLHRAIRNFREHLLVISHGYTNIAPTKIIHHSYDFGCSNFAKMLKAAASVTPNIQPLANIFGCSTEFMTLYNSSYANGFDKFMYNLIKITVSDNKIDLIALDEFAVEWFTKTHTTEELK